MPPRDILKIIAPSFWTGAFIIQKFSTYATNRSHKRNEPRKQSVVIKERNDDESRHYEGISKCDRRANQ